MSKIAKPHQKKQMYEGATKTIKDSGEVIKILIFSIGLGTYEGEECDLIQYIGKDGTRRTIQALLVEL